MKSILCFVLLVISSAMALADATAPVAPPYAAERKLNETDSLRLDWNDGNRKRNVPVKIYFPTDGAGPFPVILFSHGLGGTRSITNTSAGSGRPTGLSAFISSTSAATIPPGADRISRFRRCGKR